MFTDTQTQNKIYADLDSTLIRATHRPQDLIPVFLEALKDTPEYLQVISVIPSYPFDDDDDKWWDGEECMYFLEDLWDALDRYAPDGYYFGAIEGDGSDYGYWKVTEEE